jgi:HD-like signal output (HDOD) protein
MMLRLGEVIIGQKSEPTIAIIEAKPRNPGERWSREISELGFDEGQITAAVAERWDFPEEVVVALRCSSSPMGAESFSKLAAIVHLGALLADHASADPAVLLKLPQNVVHKLGLNLEALAAQMPDPEVLSDVSMLAGS